MTQPIAFYCRARPQDADALPIFEAAKRVFIGNPLLRKGFAYDPRALHTCLVNPTCPDDEWDREIALQLDSSAYDRNRRLVRRVTQGSMLLIHHPGERTISTFAYTKAWRPKMPTTDISPM